MQATAVVGTVSGKGYHSNGRNCQKDEASGPKKENLLLSNHCHEAKLTFPRVSLALDQRANGKEISDTDRVGGSQPSFTASPDASSESAHSRSSEFEDSGDFPFLNKTYFIHYSESEVKDGNLTHLNSELDSDMQKGEEVLFDILKHQGNKTVDLGRICRVSDEKHKETAKDTPRGDLDEDSQQEYHSAEEQELRSSRLSLGQTQAVSTPRRDGVRSAESGNEVGGAGKLGGSRARAGSSCSTSLDSVDVDGQGDSPCVSEFQNCMILREYHESVHDKCEEQEASLMYHTAFDETVLRSSPLESQESQSKSDFLSPQASLKTKICTGRLKLPVPESKEFRGNAVFENKMLQDLENPSVLPQDKALKTSLQPCQDCQASYSSLFDDSVISDAYSLYESLQSAPNQALGFSVTVPRVATRHDQAVDEEASLKAAKGNTKSEACLQSADGTCRGVRTEAAGGTVTATQAVDASTDFRACFTTSRATSASPSVVSTSSNTRITMMNKKQPGEWQSKKERSVACNTDGRRGPGNRDALAATTEGPLGESLTADNENPDGGVLHKVSLDLRNTFDNVDVKKHPEREFQLSQETEKNLPLSCCAHAVQRAARAELQLLDAHYQMCRRQCGDIYALVMENWGGLKGNLSSNTAKKELGSALLSVLGDLKVRYMSLKEKIDQGVPLEELPPLSMESKLLSAFSAFACRLIKEDARAFSGADSELDNQSTSDVDVSSSLKKILSQVSWLSDSGHAARHASPEGGGLKGGDISMDLHQMRLDDREGKNCAEMSEAWFDAQENLTGVGLSGIQESQTGQDREGPESALETKTADPLRREKGHLIHVGGLCPSVSEADLRCHFQKYHVSEIAVYGGATNYRYASLAFKKGSDAKVAVKEMNGTEIKGKPVNVRLVKAPGECAAPLSSRSGSRVGLDNLEKSTGRAVGSATSVSRLPRSRPRHLGSEQDSEFFPSDQKGVKKNCKQIESAKLLPDIPIQFIPPNTLNLRSFTKIMKRLTELHPEVSRDHIIDALQEVRINHKGFLNGLPINTIVEMTSSVLKNSASS
ncbi:RNA-binding protein 44 isoform X2 [Talpa occidentalis]|uniref:RNA-binding protein 44 isoform X2 n=1 Tax=Talpa occidentalis TaxID=50954 RepID=UPI00188E7517|nr:RNA-binding protein 44 isoform X2 [Talpa occidentalis]